MNELDKWISNPKEEQVPVYYKGSIVITRKDRNCDECGVLIPKGGTSIQPTDAMGQTLKAPKGKMYPKLCMQCGRKHAVNS